MYNRLIFKSLIDKIYIEISTIHHGHQQFYYTIIY